MGIYINPKNGMTKENWLLEYGSNIGEPNVERYNFDGKIFPICLVDNGFFTAAGVAFDKRELKVFLNPEDTRPKEWYLVNLEFIIDPVNGGVEEEDAKNLQKSIW